MGCLAQLSWNWITWTKFSSTFGFQIEKLGFIRISWPDQDHIQKRSWAYDHESYWVCPLLVSYRITHILHHFIVDRNFPKYVSPLVGTRTCPQQESPALFYGMTIPNLLMEHTHTSQETTTRRLSSWEMLLFMYILPWCAPSALNFGLLNQGVYYFFVSLLSQRIAEILKAKCPFTLTALNFFFTRVPSNKMTSIIFLLCQLQAGPSPLCTQSHPDARTFPNELSFGTTPFLLNRESCTHFSTLILGGLPRPGQGPGGKHLLTFPVLFSCLF